MSNSKDVKRSDDLLQNIRERYDGFSGSHKKVAEFMMENLELATFVSLNELSAKIGVSDATLIRFAQELGYAGFKEFREHLADYIRKIIYSQLQPPEEPSGGGNLLTRVKEADQRYIERTMDGINLGWFNQLVEMLLEAGRVYSMGWRISSFLAEFLTFQLRRIDLDAQAMVRERRTLLEQALYLGEGDLLLVFDQLLYSSEVYEAVEYVHREKPDIKIITVTNDPLAQIVQFADLSFFMDMGGQKDFSIISLTAPMCFINALVEGVIAKRPKQAQKALSRYEREVLSRRQHAMILKPKLRGDEG